ncbi:MAG: RNA-binding protein [Candidatus Aenigmarchaeota archaeon]|nr:RNA-binding protein [Candidatus Aenigmarchaeota archaeon]
MQRPLDVLGSSVEKTVIVKVKNGENISGVLKAFDSHINIWLDDASIQGDREVKLGKVLLRGDSIVYISPGK